MKKFLILTVFMSYILCLSAQNVDSDNIFYQDQKKKLGNEKMPIKSLAGSTIAYTGGGYIAGSTMILTFQLNVVSNDWEFVDGVSMTFPSGITPLESGTSNPLANPNGCSGANVNLVTPVSGQTIMWGTSNPTGCGALDQGIYNFQVNVSIQPSVTGPKTINYTIYGDGYGSNPHVINGSIVINPAPSLELKVNQLFLSNYYILDSTIKPSVEIKNMGASNALVDVVLNILNSSNTLIYTDTFSLSLLPLQTDTVNFTPLTASPVGSYTAKATILILDNDTTNNSLQKNYQVVIPKYAFAFNAYDPTSTIPTGPVKIEIPTGKITSLSSYNGDFMSGGDFVNGTWYTSQYSNTQNSKIMTIDTTSGTITEIGASGLSLTGLAYDVKTGFLYGSAYDGSNSNLVKINISTGQSYPVGSICSGIIIGIACDSAGNLYGINLNDNNLYSINKTTGAGTIIGPLGIDINYAQDIGFDRNKNKLYGTLYSSSGILAEINTNTGQATILATFPQELDALAFPYNLAPITNDIAVMGINPIPKGCHLSGSQSISVNLFNPSSSQLFNIPISYKINGSSPVTEIITVTIPSQSSYVYTFNQTANLSQDGVYNIVAYTSLPGDNNSSNDTAKTITKNFPSLQIPVSFGFETPEENETFTIIDENGGSTWNIGKNQNYARTDSGFAYYMYNQALPGKDWLITNCISMEAGKTYQLNFYYKAFDSNYNEKMKVFLGTSNTVSGMTTLLTDLGLFNHTTYQLGSKTFTVPSTGEYYIGFYAYSTPDQFAILLDDISISDVTDIVEINNDVSFKIYPNPSSELVFIEGTTCNSMIKIYNTCGQLLYEHIGKDNITTIPVLHLPSGMYYLHIIDHQTTQTIPLQILR
ncbi:MAG: choice-of-anchor J domain-containing protein [Bacteroidales bacterium]|nr:choice-of-anchor J domain-containing protein [Bacteroidales bacterium]